MASPPRPLTCPGPSGTSPPAATASPRLRVLILDGHPGPMEEARAFLECHFNAAVDTVHFDLYKDFARGQRASL